MTRIAVSIQTLADEVHARSPQTTIYFYDNGPARDSDHDPNSYGVICACDIMEGHSLNLGQLAQEIVDRRHPEAKYVIWNRRIASRHTGWVWVAYTGASDHTDHIHVSVGIGPDGYSRPPYDSTAPWLGDDMAYNEAQMRAFAWQYAGRGIAGNDDTPAGNLSTLAVLDTIYRTVLVIAAKVDIDAGELAAIQAAAKAGAEAALTESVDDIVAGIVAGLDPASLTVADVEQAVRNVLLHGAAPAA